MAGAADAADAFAAFAAGVDAVRRQAADVRGAEGYRLGDAASKRGDGHAAFLVRDGATFLGGVSLAARADFG